MTIRARFLKWFRRSEILVSLDKVNKKIEKYFDTLRERHDKNEKLNKEHAQSILARLESLEKARADDVKAARDEMKFARAEIKAARDEMKPLREDAKSGREDVKAAREDVVNRLKTLNERWNKIEERNKELFDFLYYYLRDSRSEMEASIGKMEASIGKMGASIGKLETEVAHEKGDVSKMERAVVDSKNKIGMLNYQLTLNARAMNSIFRSVFGRTLLDFVGTATSHRCFVVGNGPSLNLIDMSRLRDEVTFGSNRVFVGFEQWGFHFNHWMVQDRFVTSQNAAEFCSVIPDDVIKFIPFTLLKDFDVQRMKNIVPVNLDYSKQCTFSDSAEVLHEGFTVTVALLQIAAIMGFKEIILVGIDHNYDIKPENVTEDNKWVGKGIVTHFSDKYTNHENGQIWEMPNVEKMTRAYQAAEDWSRKNGVRILNASPNTKLEVFEKVSFDSLF